MLQFSLTNCVEPFLQCVSFSTFRSSLVTTVCQCFLSYTDSDSDCELRLIARCRRLAVERLYF